MATCPTSTRKRPTWQVKVPATSAAMCVKPILPMRCVELTVGFVHVAALLLFTWSRVISQHWREYGWKWKDMSGKHIAESNKKRATSLVKVLQSVSSTVCRGQKANVEANTTPNKKNKWCNTRPRGSHRRVWSRLFLGSQFARCVHHTHKQSVSEKYFNSANCTHIDTTHFPDSFRLTCYWLETFTFTTRKMHLLHNFASGWTMASHHNISGRCEHRDFTVKHMGRRHLGHA